MLQFNNLSQQNARGRFTFTGAATGNDFADFLLGIPDTSALAFGNADKYFRASSYDAFVNDDWRMSPAPPSIWRSAGTTALRLPRSTAVW